MEGRKEMQEKSRHVNATLRYFGGRRARRHAAGREGKRSNVSAESVVNVFSEVW